MATTKTKCLICQKTSRSEITPLVNGKFIHDDCYEKNDDDGDNDDDDDGEDDVAMMCFHKFALTTHNNRASILLAPCSQRKSKRIEARSRGGHLGNLRESYD